MEISRSDFAFDKLSHTYWIGDYRIPSISELCKVVHPSQYAGIDRSVLEAAAERGTRVHEEVQTINLALAAGKPLPAGVECGYVNAYLDFARDNKMREYVNIERPMCRAIDGKWFAGTPDLIAVTEAGMKVIIEVKTTAKLEPIIEVQLAGLAILSGCEETYSLLLRSDGDYEMRRHEPLFDVFKAALDIWNYRERI